MQPLFKPPKLRSMVLAPGQCVNRHAQPFSLSAQGSPGGNLALTTHGLPILQLRFGPIGRQCHGTPILPLLLLLLLLALA